jgi:putative peptide zinc metalloprotease protein
MSTTTNSANPASMQTSTQRAVPLEARKDLSVRAIHYMGANYWVVKDPVALKYFRFQPEQYKILTLLDGQRNLEQIRDEFHKEFPTVRLTVQDVQNLITDLHRTGLVYSNRMGQGAALVKRDRENKNKKLWQTLKNILYLRLPGWDPEKTLKVIHPYFNWLYQWYGVVLWFAMVLSASTLLLVHFREFQSKLPAFHQFFSWPNIMYMWLILGMSKIIHEFGHGLTCKHFMGECHEMGVLLLVFSPCLYCDVSDSWLLQNKWKRIMIGAAGMYIEILLSAFAIFGWWYSKDGLFNYLCLNLFFVSTVSTVIFNANPLMRYDGYYMLSDFLEIPNLRPKADRLMKEKFAWYCLGIEAKPDPFMPQRGQFWFILFAVAANIYKWVVMYGILLFFYTFLKPYKLQSIGATMALFSIGGIVGGMFFSIYQMITAPRIEPLNYRKVTLSLIVFGALLWAGLRFPIPWYVEAPLVVEPKDVKHVYTKIGGQLVQRMRVKPGDTVKEGDVIAVLVDPQMDMDEQDLNMKLSLAEAEIHTYNEAMDPGQAEVAEKSRDSVLKQLKEFKERKKLLTIRAPGSGTVVAPPRTPEPKYDVTRTTLPRWVGTPMDEKNIGSTLEPKTHLCSIAPNEYFQAVLMVDQADRNDVKLTDPVRVKLDHMSHKTYIGHISEIAERHSEFCPPALSNKYGGDLATTQDKEGRERLTSIAYQATVILDTDVEFLKNGLRGRARVKVDNRSVGQWIYRYLLQTFHFRL